MATSHSKALSSQGSIESGIEQRGGWGQGDKARFDGALLGKDRKKILSLLPRVPKDYRERFKKEILSLNRD